MAILANWFAGDDEPAWELSEQDLAEGTFQLEEAEALEREAEDWRLTQPEGEDA